MFGFLKGVKNTRVNSNIVGLDPIGCKTAFQNNMVLLVNMDKFDPNHVLVNVNKLKPYVPYDNNTKGLVFKFQGGRREGTIVEK